MNAVEQRPLVHIGYHKTATTWFQESFYPAVRNASYVGRRAAQNAFLCARAFNFSADEARRVINDASGGDRPLICEEDLSGYLHNGGLGGLLSREVAHRIWATLPNAVIVVAIRSQPRMVEASYSQYVRRGGTHSPRRYVNAQRTIAGAGRYWYKAPLFQLDHFNYQPLLDTYAELFGREAVRVFLYEEFGADPRAFLARFAGEHGLDVDLHRLDFHQVNSSLTRRDIAVLRRLNLFTRASVIDKRSYLSGENWYDARWTWLRRIERPLEVLAPAKKGSLLPRDLKDEIADHFRQGNARLAREWQLPLADYGYPLP